MDLIISILVYTLTGVILFFLARGIVKADNLSLLKSGEHGTMWTRYFVWSIVIFATIAGARYNTGVDHLNYLHSYLTGDMGRMENGFDLITKLFSSVGLHYFFYFAFLASFQIGFIYFACKHKRELLPYVALAIMLGPYFLEWMNGIRQTIIACLFVYLVAYYSSNKTPKSFWLCILWILAATFIHRSSLILLPLLLLCRLNITFKNRLIAISSVIVCLIIGMTPFWIGLFSDNLFNILDFLQYDKYTMRFDKVMDEESFKVTAFGPLRMTSLAIDLMIIWSYSKMTRYFCHDRVLTNFFILFYVGVCAFNLFANTSHLFLRPIYYLNLFKLPMVAYFLVYLKKTKSFWFYVVALFEFSYNLIDVSKSALYGIKDYNFYHFFFFSQQTLLQ